MFAPRYSITNKTLNSLIEIELAGNLISLASLQNEWIERLRVEALTRRLFGVLRFEGCRVTLDDVSKIVRDDPGRDDSAKEVAMRSGVVAVEKDVQKALNLINTGKLIEQIAYLSSKFRQEYGMKELVQINSLLGERLVSSDKNGKWRGEETEGAAKGEKVLPVEIPFQVEDVFNWSDRISKTEIHPILKAGIIYYEILRITPFSDHNEQTAVDYFRLVLNVEGLGFKKMWAYEDDLLRNPESLRVAYDSVEKNSGDMTVWLEFLSRTLSESAGKIKTRILNLVGESPVFKSENNKVIPLSERQITIMEELTLRNELTIKEVRGVLPTVSDDTILRDLNDLIKKKLVRKKGKTKGSTYVMHKLRRYK